jgi:hypothetical protein
MIENRNVFRERVNKAARAELRRYPLDWPNKDVSEVLSVSGYAQALQDIWGAVAFSTDDDDPLVIIERFAANRGIKLETME